MKKVVTIVVIFLVLVSGTFLVLRTSSSSVGHGVRQVVTSAARSSDSGHTSVSNDSTSSAVSTSNLEQSSGSVSTSSAANPNALEQNTSISQSNSLNEPTSPTEGEGHAVHNGQEAIDVIQNAYKSAGLSLDGLGFDFFIDDTHPNDFTVQSVIKAYRLDGGTGTADTYRVEPSGHYSLVN